MLDMVLRTADMEHLSFRDTVDCEGDNDTSYFIYSVNSSHRIFLRW